MKKLVKITVLFAGLITGSLLFVFCVMFVPKICGLSTFPPGMEEGITSLGRLAKIADAAGIGKIISGEIPFRYKYYFRNAEDSLQSQGKIFY